MSELETRPIGVIHPLTGETLAVRDASTDQLARFLDECREYESMLREAKATVSREVTRRMDFAGTYTLRAEGYELKSQSPLTEEWNAEGLAMDLADLADAGHISDEAVRHAVKIETTYKVQAIGIGALRKLGGVVRDTVNKHATEVERRRYVKVERA